VSSTMLQNAPLSQNTRAPSPPLHPPLRAFVPTCLRASRFSLSRLGLCPFVASPIHGKNSRTPADRHRGVFMKLGLINSAFAQAGKAAGCGLEQPRRIGFDTVDIFTDPLDIDVRERRLIKDTADELALPIKSICCVALGLVDFNPSVQRF